MADIFKKSKPTEADEAVKAAVTDEAFNTVTDEQVATERKETGASIDRTMGEVHANSESDIDSANEGAKGVKVSALFKKVTGAPKAMSASTAATYARGWTPNGTPTNYSAADADHLERNAQMAAIAFENVHADILREATAGTENGDTVIIGTPGDNNVYSEETDITARTVTSDGVYYPPDHPRKRENGTLMLRKSQFVSISGDYLHETTVSGSTYAGHDSQKNFLEYENLLFNKLDANGAFVSRAIDGQDIKAPVFVAPKRGRFWLKGISLAPKTASPMTTVAYVKRKVDGTDIICPVEQASGNGIFEVVELTPTADLMTQAAAETARLLTCAKSKFTLGQAEAVAQIFAKAQEVIDQPTEIITWPEYARTGRSTLSFCNQGKNTSYSCYNDLETYAEFMHYLQESEVMHAIHRINNEGLKTNLKFARNMEGQNARYSYWNAIFGGNPNNAANLASPSAALYAATKSSTRAFNTMGKWIYTFRTFWSDLEAYCGAFDEGVLDDRILSQIKIGKDACDQIATQLKLGTITGADGMTSSVLAAAPNTVDIILGFDPNDLVDYSLSSGSIAVAYPAAGYQNIYTRTSALDSEYVIYHIIPTWMQILLHAVNSPAFMQRMLDTSVRIGSTNYNARSWFAAGNYAQINVDTLRPSWISLVLSEATLMFKERVFSPRNQVSGFLRYLKAGEAFGTADVYAYDMVPIHDLIREVCGGEGYFFKATATNPTHFGVLDTEVLKQRFDEDVYRPAIYYHDGGTGTGKSHCLVMQPSRIHSYVSNLEGWQYRIGPDGDWTDFPSNCDTDGNDSIADVATLIATAEADEDFDMRLFWSRDGRDAILASKDGHALVYCRRKLAERAALTVEVPQFGADDSILGFHDNPQEYLYGCDSHRNLPACDEFVLCAHFGAINDAEATANGNAATANWYFAPAFTTSVAASGTDDDFHLDQCTGRGLKLMSQKNTRNKFYDIANAEVTSRLMPALNGYGKYASQPSLWGYQRVTLGGVGDITYSAANTARSSSITSQAVITSGVTNLQGYYLFGWKARTIAQEKGIAVGSDDPATVSLYLSWDVDTTAVGDWRWYIEQQLVASTDHMFYGTSNADAVAYQSAADLVESCGYVADPVFLVGYPTASALVYSDAIASSDDGSVRGVQVSDWGRTVNLDNYVAMRDFSDLYFTNMWQMPTLVEVGFATNNTSNGKTEINFIGSFDQMRNLATRSRLYRNDIRKYKTDRPVLKLNRNWFIYGLTTPLFVERFSK